MSKRGEQLLRKVAYVIVSWNNRNLLGTCLDSIRAQDYPNKHVILVDNDSKDGTVEYLRTNFPEIEVIAEKRNHGFARGNNIGIRKALKDPEVAYIVLLNTDATLAKDWTSTLVRTAQMKPRVATLQSITLDYYDHGIIDSTHIYLSHYGQAIQSSWRLPIAYANDVAPQKVFGCNAAAMLITRAFIEAQPFDDLFDETMFMYLEDVDLAARATVMGWDNYVVSGTRAYHMGSVSSKKKDPSFSLYMTFRNNLGMMIKNMPPKILFALLVRIPKSDQASIRHLKRIGQGGAVPALIKGRIMSLAYVPIFIWKRHKLRPQRNVDADYLWRLMRRGY